MKIQIYLIITIFLFQGSHQQISWEMIKQAFCCGQRQREDELEMTNIETMDLGKNTSYFAKSTHEDCQNRKDSSIDQAIIKEEQLRKIIQNSNIFYENVNHEYVSNLSIQEALNKIVEDIKNKLSILSHKEVDEYIEKLTDIKDFYINDDDIVTLNYGLWLLYLKQINIILIQFYSTKETIINLDKFNEIQQQFHQKKQTIKMNLDILCFTLNSLLNIATKNPGIISIQLIVQDMMEKYKLFNFLILNEYSMALQKNIETISIQWSTIHKYVEENNLCLTIYEPLAKSNLYDTTIYGYDGWNLSSTEILYKMDVISSDKHAY